VKPVFNSPDQVFFHAIGALTSALTNHTASFAWLETYLIFFLQGVSDAG
jgi:hypothetical protein